MFAQALPDVTLSLVGLVFAEGLLAFLPPCILPMLPIYLMYLCGTDDLTSGNRRRLIGNTLSFIAGFTIVFVLLGATASSLGQLLIRNRDLLQRLGGVVVIAFGLNHLGVIKIAILNRARALEVSTKNLGVWSSMVFGAAFSIGWTPCLGAFLGTSLLLASNASTLWAGIGLLFVFSLGLGIPFFLTALLWNQLQGTLDFIKRHLHVIQLVSGILLIVIGITMVTGIFGYYLGLFI